MTEKIGITIGETTPTEVKFISTKTILRGQYVCLDLDNQVIMGMVTSVRRGNSILQENDSMMMPNDIEKIKEIVKEGDEYTTATVKLLGDTKSFRLPRKALKPYTDIREATINELSNVFSNNELQVGTLVSNNSVTVSLNADEMVSKHLAILATTGAGKSNTTSIILNELLRYHGCILLFDVHGEYRDITFSHGKVNKITPKVNVGDLRSDEFVNLIPFLANAPDQRTIIRKAVDGTPYVSQYHSNYLEDILKYIDNMSLVGFHNPDKARSGAKRKLEHAQKRILKKLDGPDVPPLIEQIKPNCVNILDCSTIDDEVCNFLMTKLLHEILQARQNEKLDSFPKPRLEYPVFCVIEEAHTFASKGSDNTNISQSKDYVVYGPKHYIAKIAKEGRKFGVGLGLISQRPYQVDPEILSQMNNWVVLKIIDPSDQHYIQTCSDSLSTEMVDELPNLNTGEAVITGPMTTLPCITQINHFEGKSIGRNNEILKEWQQCFEDGNNMESNDFPDWAEGY